MDTTYKALMFALNVLLIALLAHHLLHVQNVSEDFILHLLDVTRVHKNAHHVFLILIVNLVSQDFIIQDRFANYALSIVRYVPRQALVQYVQMDFT